jgi:hypothetical protein
LTTAGRRVIVGPWEISLVSRDGPKPSANVWAPPCDLQALARKAGVQAADLVPRMMPPEGASLEQLLESKERWRRDFPRSADGVDRELCDRLSKLAAAAPTRSGAEGTDAERGRAAAAARVGSRAVREVCDAYCLLLRACRTSAGGAAAGGCHLRCMTGGFGPESRLIRVAAMGSCEHL